MATLPEKPKDPKKMRVAVVDDDESLNRSLVIHLQEGGFEVDSYVQGREALAPLLADPTDLVLLDIRLKDADGIDILQQLKQAHPAICVVMITAFHETALTVEASKLGAFDYLPKPLNLDRLDAIIARALTRRAASKAGAEALCSPSLPDGAESGTHDQHLIGSSPGMLEVLKTIGIVARSEATALVLGESGTGKEVVARKIHAHSHRRGAFLSVNCATLTAELLSSELFGHEKGAFTGAVSRRRGTFELADGGTLLLDEVSEMDSGLQAKLLRVLQEREFRRLGGSETIQVDVRVVAATNRDLAMMVEQGGFRSDLYFRLAVIPIFLPPLRERLEDLPLLVEHFLRRLTRSPSGQRIAISSEAMERLRRHTWPGNVRELQNVIVRAGLEAKGPVILAEDLFLQGGGAQPLESADQDEDDLRSLKELERDHIASVLRHTDGKKSEAARILGISRPTLDSKLKRYSLRVGRTLEEQ